MWRIEKWLEGDGERYGRWESDGKGGVWTVGEWW